jgi:hypothetical protein
VASSQNGSRCNWNGEDQVESEPEPSSTPTSSAIEV